MVFFWYLLNNYWYLICVLLVCNEIIFLHCIYSSCCMNIYYSCYKEIIFAACHGPFILHIRLMRKYTRAHTHTHKCKMLLAYRTFSAKWEDGFVLHDRLPSKLFSEKCTISSFIHRHTVGNSRYFHFLCCDGIPFFQLTSLSFHFCILLKTFH